MCVALLAVGTLAGCGGSNRETLNGSLICTEKPQNFAPTARPSHNVSIHNISGPQVNIPAVAEEGFFDWRVYFEVNRDAGSAGHVIQEVNHDCQVVRHGNLTSVEPPLRYWEAWPVDANQKYTRDYANGKTWDDRFGFNAEANHSKGFMESTAIVRFYEGDLPEHFVEGSVKYAGSLLASVSAPDFWEYEGTAHVMRLEWDLTSDDRNARWWQYTVQHGNQQRTDSWGKVPAAGVTLP